MVSVATVVACTIGGMMVGCFIGVTIMCLLFAGKEADRQMGIIDNE